MAVMNVVESTGTVLKMKNLRMTIPSGMGSMIVISTACLNLFMLYTKRKQTIVMRIAFIAKMYFE
jgi:hypothetical protein